MAASRPADPASRIAELERQVQDLKARVIALERLVGSSAEHPADDSVVRKKVVYDWQA